MGDGKRRNVDCDDVNCHVGPVEEQRLLSPVALAAASDGSVYVGDYNLIRRIRPGANIIYVSPSLMMIPNKLGGHLDNNTYNDFTYNDFTYKTKYRLHY